MTPSDATVKEMTKSYKKYEVEESGRWKEENRQPFTCLSLPSDPAPDSYEADDAPT
jgi:hypothetical protein